MTTFSLPNNFFINARGLTFEDSASVTWAFNKNLNQISATVISAIPSGANPSASIGLTAVNGTAVTFMRSDAAPALSQAIIPTWTGLHTFSAGITVSAGTFTLSGHTLALSANATVGGTNTGDQILPVGGNPGATIGLAAQNGSATTFMRSDGAPALSQTIAPTWTGTHWFNATFGIVNNIQGVSPGSTGNGGGLVFSAPTGFTDEKLWDFSNGASGTTSGTGVMQLRTVNDAFNAANVAIKVTRTGTVVNGVQINCKVGINGNAPPAQVTGWGTPTGQTVVNSFAAGATPSLLQMSEAVAQIITDLKAFGLYGA